MGCKNILKPFLPLYHVVKQGESYTFENMPQSIGSVKEFYGNFGVVVRALTYVLNLGMAGLREASQMAVLNANYMRVKIAPYCKIATDGICMHEFVMTLKEILKETGVSAKDVAKAMLDYGIHPPTMYFPLIVEEALMVEPTETESVETLDAACDAIIAILKQAKSDPEQVKSTPHTTPIGRPDEVTAARSPKLRYVFGA